MKKEIIICLPSKGRLNLSSLNIFKKKKLKIVSAKGDRDLIGYVKNKKFNLKILFVHARECIDALANSNTVSTILPGTTFFLNKDKYANGRKFIDKGCTVSLASDFNPGTCTIRSLSNIMFLAMHKCGLSLEESFLGVTYNAAKSLQKEESIGLIRPNYMADFIFWNINKLDEIPYWFDSSITKIVKVVKNGIPELVKS